MFKIASQSLSLTVANLPHQQITTRPIFYKIDSLFQRWIMDPIYKKIEGSNKTSSLELIPPDNEREYYEDKLYIDVKNGMRKKIVNQLMTNDFAMLDFNGLSDIQKQAILTDLCSKKNDLFSQGFNADQIDGYPHLIKVTLPEEDVKAPHYDSKDPFTQELRKGFFHSENVKRLLQETADAFYLLGHKKLLSVINEKTLNEYRFSIPLKHHNQIAIFRLMKDLEGWGHKTDLSLQNCHGVYHLTFKKSDLVQNTPKTEELFDAKKADQILSKMEL